MSAAALLLKPASEPASAWVAEFAKLLPEVEVRVWPDIGNASEIAYALVANLPFGQLAKLPNLRLIVSLPVGLDHLLNDPDLPRNVPFVRCVNPDGDPGMTEFVLMHVLRHHRRLPEYAMLQSRREWTRLPYPPTHERRVGIMGLGTFGAAAARALREHGFDVAGWSRTLKCLDGVRCYAGSDGLCELLERTEILVCMLPATRETVRLLNRSTLSRLPRDAGVINVARGSVLVEADLLELLDCGHLSAATLDVTDPEPLPSDSGLWTHPAVTLTPHVASVVQSRIAAPIVAENIRRLHSGAPLLNRVDREAGY